VREIQAEFPAAQAAGRSATKPPETAAEKAAVDPPQPYRKVIASYVSPHAFSPRTRAALVGLGYRVVAASTRGRFDNDSWQPDLRIVDDRHFDKLPEENFLPRTPVIVLSGAKPREWRDSRVVGEVTRPADLAEIYPLIQKALEEYPRRAARTPTQLPARCTREERRWMGAIVSLSSNGCLFRTNSEMSPGLDFNLLFPLPRGRMVSTRARAMQREGNQLGMAFTNPPEPSRQAIAEFVSERLATAYA
jgi:hypothetical protein